MADIASSCSLDPAALADRLTAWKALDGAVLSRRTTPSGVEARYRLEPGLGDRLLELMDAESDCCPGLVFEATVTLVVSEASVHSSG